MNRRWAVLWLGIAVAGGIGSALAETRPAITVYGSGVGLVHETRAVDLRGAGDTLRLTDLPSSLDFSSLRFMPPGGARVTRLAWRNDVDSGDRLLGASLGSRVRVLTRGDRANDGVLVAMDPSWLVLRGDDGGVTTLSRTAVDAVQLLHPPGPLSLRPTLEVALAGGRRVRGEAMLSYLTGGLAWSAEHVLVREGETGGSWSASVTVENTSGRDYVDARLQLVAGDLARATPPPVPVARTLQMQVKLADLSEQGFSEYHLYTLDRPATLRDRETQALTMIEPRRVRLHPHYLYRGDGGGVGAQLELTNDAAAGGPGVPLPAGRVRIYENDPAGMLALSGESHIPHTPVGEKVTLDLGVAFDLAAERKVTSERRISDREHETSVEIRLRNRKKAPVTIVCEENVGGDVEVTKSSHPPTRKDANTIQFSVPVPAGREAVLTYTVHVRL